MSRYVVDASVAVKWFLPEPHSDAALRLLDGTHQLLAPDFMLAEFGNVIWTRERRRELTPPEGGDILRAILDVRIGVLPTTPLLEPAFDLATITGQALYDLLYVALAIETDCPLVTADQALLRGLAGAGLESHLRWVEDPV